MKRPLVLNTRPRDQASDLSALLSAAGFDVVDMPAIEIESAWDAAELQRSADYLQRGAYSWLVLQSANAGRMLPLERVNIMCGARTAQTLRIHAAHTLERFSASVALRILQPLLREGERVLVPRAADGRDELTEGLRAMGIAVDAPVAYRTVPVSPSTLASVRDLAVDVVTVCSPSAVRALLAGVGGEWLAARHIVSLGATTTQAASDLGLHVDATAERTSIGSLVQAVTTVLRAVR